MRVFKGQGGQVTWRGGMKQLLLLRLCRMKQKRKIQQCNAVLDIIVKKRLLFRALNKLIRSPFNFTNQSKNCLNVFFFVDIKLFFLFRDVSRKK